MLHKIRKSFSNLDDRQKNLVWHPSTERIRDLPALFWQNHSIRWGLILTVLGATLLVADIGAKFVSDSSYNNSVFLGAALACLAVAIGFIGWTSISGRFRHSLFAFYLSRSQCPACLTDMRRQPVEDDNCVICPNPKCNAAWKITDQVAQP